MKPRNRAYEAYFNGRRYKKIVIIKMNKILYFYVLVKMLTRLCFSDDFNDLEGFLM